MCMCMCGRACACVCVCVCVCTHIHIHTYAAWRSQLAVGDKITAVDGQGLAGSSLAQVVQRLMGVEGTSVIITIDTGGCVVLRRHRSAAPSATTLVRADASSIPYAPSHLRYQIGVNKHTRSTAMNNGVTTSDSLGGGGSSSGEEGAGAVRQALLQSWYAQTAAPYAETAAQLPSNANASLVPNTNTSLYSNPPGPSPLPPPPPAAHRQHQVGNDIGREGGSRDLSRPAVDLAREVADKDAQIERLTERLQLALESQSHSLAGGGGGAGDGGGGRGGGGGGGGGREWMSSSLHSAGALEASAQTSLTQRNLSDERASGQP
jgi:hypothetical protein